MLTNTRTQAGKAIELKDEMELVIKAVRLNTLAKLTFQDTQVYLLAMLITLARERLVFYCRTAPQLALPEDLYLLATPITLHPESYPLTHET